MAGGPVDDPEGDALERELRDDRAAAGHRRLQALLLLPPLIALGVGVALLSSAAPEAITVVRVWSGARPAGDVPALLRVFVTDEDIETAQSHPRRAGSVGVSSIAPPRRRFVVPLDEQGVAEAAVPAETQVRLDLGPTDVDVDLRRWPAPSFHAPKVPPCGNDDGLVSVRPDGGSLSLDGEAGLWVLARTAAGAPDPRAKVSFDVDSGAEPIAPIETDEDGLAWTPLRPIAPPFVVGVRVASATGTRTVRCELPFVSGVPEPITTLWEVPSEPAWRVSARAGYADVFQGAVRVGGGPLGSVTRSIARLGSGLPEGVLVLETRDGPWPQSDPHTGRYAVVHAADPVTALGSLREAASLGRWGAHGPAASLVQRRDLGTASPSIDRARRLVRAALSFGELDGPAWTVLADTRASALDQEHRRQARRRASALAAVAVAAVVEVFLFGVLYVGRSPTLAAPHLPSGSRLTAAAVGATIALVFAALLLLFRGLS